MIEYDGEVELWGPTLSFNESA